MTDDKIMTAIKNNCVEKDGKCKLSCPAAFNIAKELGVDLKKITEVCNTNNIKINNCQLGCFE
ncbi:MAG TPA: hypothetical protein QF753_07070 [Victivallales bacterium]|nr:hypothetical protein [Victivallales bacterium]